MTTQIKTITNNGQEQKKKRPPTHGLWCSPKLWERVREYAATLEHRSMNFVIVRAVEEYLDKHEEGK